MQVVALAHEREQARGPAGGAARPDGSFSWFLAADAPAAAGMAVTPRCRGSVPEAAACDQGSGEDGADRRADAAANHATCVMASHADRREARSQKAAWPMAAPASRPETGRPEGPPVTSRRRRP